MKAASDYRLTREQIDHFHDKGYVHPLTLCSPEEMAQIRPLLERVVQTKPANTHRFQSRHLDSRAVYDLCSHPSVVEAVASLIGDDVVLWRSNFFYKQPGDPPIPWHQDTEYWPIEPTLNISAWLALEETTKENGCVQVIPGSHKRIYPHPRKDTGHAGFQTEADTSTFDPSEAEYMELQAGQFFIFNEKTLHYSDPIPAGSSRTRFGMAIRLTAPFVKVNHHEIFPGHRAMMVKGQDRFGFNDYTEPPAP